MKRLIASLLALTCVCSLNLITSAAPTNIIGQTVDEDGNIAQHSYDTIRPGSSYYYVIGSSVEYGNLVDDNLFRFRLKKQTNGKYISDADLVEKKFDGTRYVCIKFSVKENFTSDEYKVEMDAEFRAKQDLQVITGSNKDFPNFRPVVGFSGSTLQQAKEELVNLEKVLTENINLRDQKLNALKALDPDFSGCTLDNYVQIVDKWLQQQGSSNTSLVQQAQQATEELKKIEEQRKAYQAQVEKAQADVKTAQDQLNAANNALSQAQKAAQTALATYNAMNERLGKLNQVDAAYNSYVQGKSQQTWDALKSAVGNYHTVDTATGAPVAYASSQLSALGLTALPEWQSVPVTPQPAPAPPATEQPNYETPANDEVDGEVSDLKDSTSFEEDSNEDEKGQEGDAAAGQEEEPDNKKTEDDFVESVDGDQTTRTASAVVFSGPAPTAATPDSKAQEIAGYLAVEKQAINEESVNGAAGFKGNAESTQAAIQPKQEVVNQASKNLADQNSKLKTSQETLSNYNQNVKATEDSWKAILAQAKQPRVDTSTVAGAKANLTTAIENVASAQKQVDDKKAEIRRLESIGSGNGLLKSGETYTHSFKLWIQNENLTDDDATFVAGESGIVIKPVKNEKNTVTWENNSGSIARMTFTADSDATYYCPQLSTKWDRELDQFFPNADAYLFDFVDNPYIPAVTRATLEIYNPFVDDDGDLTVRRSDLYVYSIDENGKLQDVTSSFAIGENQDGDEVLSTRTWKLGTYIVSDTKAKIKETSKPENPEKPGTSENPSKPSVKPNPGTGR